jgi:putative ABC transport system permease protein
MRREDVGRLTRWLLTHLLSERDFKTLQSEMAELHRLRARREGSEAADRRLRRDTRTALWHAFRHGITTSCRRATRARATSRASRRDTLPGLLREARLAARRLARTPVFTATVVTTLAMGLGGTTAVYSLVHGVLIEPLPYPEPDRLVRIHTAKAEDEWGFSMADYVALVKQQKSFVEVAAFDPNPLTYTTRDGAERIASHSVTPSFFTLLGIVPIRGRTFDDAESMPDAPALAVVSWGFWQSRLGGSPDVVGSVLQLDDTPHEVVGVLPREVGPIENGRDVLTNLRVEQPSRKGPVFLTVIGRVAPGVDPRSAGAELRAINDRIFPMWRDSWTDREATWAMDGLKDWVVGATRQSLWVLLAAVGFLLLIALSNAANLLVARGAEQHHELVVRRALGASRRRILLHLASESVMLMAVGGLTGLGLAAVAVRLASRLGPDLLPRLNEVGLGSDVIAFYLLVTLGALALAGLVPAAQSSGRRVTWSSRAEARGGSAGRALRRMRRGLVGLQFAVTCPLLIGGGLLLTSLDALLGVDPGFDADSLLTVGVALPAESRLVQGRSYDDGDAIRQFWSDLSDRVLATPGVEAVGTSNGRPPDDPGFGNNFVLADIPLAVGESQPSVPWSISTAGYFSALGVDLVAGEMFDMRAQPTRVALVDETWARRFFGDAQSAVGRRFLQGGCTVPERCEWWRVIGVVEDVEYNGLANADRGAMYLDGERFTEAAQYVVIRTTAIDPGSLLPAVRDIIRDLEPGAPITNAATGRELLRDSLRQPRYLTALVGVFGTLALLLSLVGIYGVMTHFVEQHRRDIGIRLALGGRAAGVSRLVVLQAGWVVVLGTGAGVTVALLLARLLEGVLFGVQARDPTTYALVAVSLIAAALLITWIPARRAAGTDPMSAIRAE